MEEIAHTTEKNHEGFFPFEGLMKPFCMCCDFERIVFGIAVPPG
jgi:hypothetical protein